MRIINGEEFGLESLIEKLHGYGASEALKIRVKDLHEELHEVGYDAGRFERDDEFEWCLREACRVAYEKGCMDQLRDCSVDNQLPH